MRIKIKDVLAGLHQNSCIKIKGWVRTRRDSKGGFSFIEINDGSAFDNLQIIAPAELSNYTSEVQKLFTGASVCVSGQVAISQGKGQSYEILADSVEVLGYTDPNQYPIQKQKTSLDHLRTIPHLRPRTNTFGAITRVRNQAAMAVHKFFQERYFYWISTPLITPSDCEGAGELFKVTTLDLNNPAKDKHGNIDYKQDFFGKPTFLTVSGQLNVESYACSLGDVYTFGPTFRAENSNTTRHLSEFWMIEPEMSFADLDDDMSLSEVFVKQTIKNILNSCQRDLEFFDLRIQKGLIKSLEDVVNSNFARISYTKAIEILKNANRSWEYPIDWGCDFQAEHERYLTEEYAKKPVIVHDWPASIKPFYMRLSDDKKTVAAMDVLVPRFGEIIGGSQREERLDILESRMLNSNMNLDEYWWYRDLRKFGSIPHAGFGLGFERLLQFVTGVNNIRDVIPYPRTPKTAEI